MKFTKMHGLGNDYIYIDCMDGSLGGSDSSLVSDDKYLGNLSRTLSDRHCSIGGDGIIMILPSGNADFRMRIFNADGSEAKMCGNGVRCIGKYVYDHGHTDSENITLETLSGVKSLRLFPAPDGRVESVTVDMGEPVFEPSAIPVIVAPGCGNTGIRVDVGGVPLEVVAVSMGNPHGVVFVESLDSVDVHALGAALEVHPMWPDRANIEFAEIVSPTEIRMRVWERGSGETMACGTGACATAVAALLTGKIADGNEVTVHLRGGDLRIVWNRTDNHVMMTGSATEAFTGEVDIPASADI